MEKGSIFLLSFATLSIFLGAIIGLSLHFTVREEEKARQDTVADCFPAGFGHASEQKCLDKGCEWQLSSEGGPACLYPEGHGYIISGDIVDTNLGFNVGLSHSGDANPTTVTDLTLSVEYHSESRLRIKISDTAGARYVVPEEAVNIPSPVTPPSEEDRLYEVHLVEEPQFGIQVIRKSSGGIIFDTALPGFTFEDQYIQLTTRLNSSHVYGFGEHNHRRFKHDMNFKTWAIFTRDVAPVDEWNLYGAQTLYMNLEESLDANGVFLLNSNAMDIMLQPDPHPGISYHVIGGILDFYIFLGPTPENVVQQYTEALGRPFLPPYWSLGFQLSRWDYHNLTYVKHIVNRNLDAGIPLDVQYGDIDHMESKLDFTYDKDLYDGLPQFVDDLHSIGMKYVVIQDHCIGSNTKIFDTHLGGVYKPYDDGISMDIFIHDADGGLLEGEVWPGTTYYPDFTMLGRTGQWWTSQCVDFFNGTRWGVEYDALWIDMNEPSNFIEGSLTGCDETSLLNHPPYVPNILGWNGPAIEDKGQLTAKTICMDAPQHWGLHYDTHNLYGHGHSITSWNTLRAMFPEKRPFVLTRSQFAGSQKYAGHWLGDNQSLWEQIPWSIVGMLEYSLFGFSYTGADICGFWFAATEEMCQRWMQLGAFYPYARNHNAQGWPDQDPAAFSAEMVRVSRDILMTRYKLLPFLYTLLYEAHSRGSTVVRPLLHQFTSDPITWDLDHQFLWGSALMITPAMEEGQRYINAYFPNTRWYDYYGGLELSNTGSWHNLSTPLDKINLHVPGGNIIPWQEPANTTVYSRRNPLGMIVAMGDAPLFTTSGSLFWDDGEIHDPVGRDQYLEISMSCSKPNAHYILDVTVLHDTYRAADALYWREINVWGLPKRPDHVTVNGEEWIQIQYDSLTKAVDIINLNLTVTDNHRLEWNIVF